MPSVILLRMQINFIDRTQLPNQIHNQLWWHVRNSSAIIHLQAKNKTALSVNVNTQDFIWMNGFYENTNGDVKGMP